jgi:murein DD-endopeptidase MepM/ murein hydrolase activator NlpD
MKVLQKIVFSISLVLLFGGLFIEGNAQNVPITDVPAGFGRYCSALYPNGKWGLKYLPGANSDPCANLIKPGLNGNVQRSGLWSTDKNNNVMRICDGDLGIYRQKRSEPLKLAYDDAAGKKNCVFIISPYALPVFSKPYKVYYPFSEANVTTTNTHNYNFFKQPNNPADFGQPKNNSCPDSKVINRLGQQVCRAHGGFDWLMPPLTDLLAVADGIVRVARWRDVRVFAKKDDGTTDKNADCYKKSPQGEIYVEHQIGVGQYSERFLTYYAHVSKISVKPGAHVTRGQLLGKSGDSGCSSAPHLHFGVVRTTNLSGQRFLSNIAFPETGYGINDVSGQIDPFGWNAPQGVDPWAWKYLGVYQDEYVGTVTNPGAFSIRLWREGQAPPYN